MAASIFPEGMTSSNKDFSIESIAGKLNYFSLQLHLLHWQTFSYAEHKAIDGLYDYINSFTDDVIEKLMGYTGKRPKAYKIESLKEGLPISQLTKEISQFSYDLYVWAGEKHYCDIENMAQSLSGEANKTLYLLTLS